MHTERERERKGGASVYYMEAFCERKLFFTDSWAFPRVPIQEKQSITDVIQDLPIILLRKY